jgi:hypothetical protein
MEPFIVEVSVSVGDFALRTYMEHRQHVIDEGKADELISNRVKKYVNEQYTRMSSPSSGSATATAIATNKIETTDVRYSSKLRNYLRNITPNRNHGSDDNHGISGNEHTEFHEFVRKLLVFVRNESICQATDNNSHLLKHKHYRELLMKSLADQSADS